MPIIRAQLTPNELVLHKELDTLIAFAPHRPAARLVPRLAMDNCDWCAIT